MTFAKSKIRSVHAVERERTSPFGPILAVIAVVAGLSTVVRNVQMAIFSGGNNLSNDYLAFAPVVERMLSGGYADVFELLRASFIGSHMMLGTLLVFAANATFFSWHALSDILLAQLLALGRCWLLFDCFSEKADGWKRGLLLGALLVLNFGATQASVLHYGAFGVSVGLTLLGFCFALWSLCKGRDSVLGLLGVVAGGFLSSLSWGNVPPCWIALLAALFLQKTRRWAPYMVALICLAINLLPYVFLYPHHGEQCGADRTALISFANMRVFLNTLGRPFANDIAANPGSLPLAESSSVWGILILGLLALLFTRAKRLPSAAKAGAAVALYGASSVYMISLFRWTVSPWYVPFATMFWCGIVSGIYSLLVHTGAQFTAAKRALAVLSIGSIGVLYLFSNLSFSGKNLYAHTRTLSSESVLRNSATAPTYGESTLFEWGCGNPGYVQALAEPLRRRNWSCFSVHQQIALQGEFILDSVRTELGNNGEQPFWSVNSSRTGKKSWSSSEHLNLILSGGSHLKWSFDLPSNVSTAVFKTEVVAGRMPGQPETGQAMLGVSDGDSYEHQLFRLGKDRRTVALPLKIDGKRKTLTLESISDQRAKWSQAVFVFPRLELEFNPNQQTSVETPTCPSNTELSPAFVANTPNDRILPLEAAFWWPSQPEIARSDALVWRVNRATQAESCMPDVQVADYSHLIIGARGSQSIKPRAIAIEVVTDKQDRALFYLPLLADGNHHRYSYPVRLMELSDGARITSMKILPTRVAKDQEVVVDEIRFVRSTDPGPTSACPRHSL